MSGPIPKNATACSPTVRDDEIVLDWILHPARREPRKLIGIGAVAFLIAIFGFWILDAALPVVVMMIMLVASISDFLFPTSYTVTRRGVRAGSLFNRTSMSWSSVRRICRSSDGVKLSPFMKPSRLDAFRGVYLRYDGNEAEVLTAISELRKTSDD